jgi:hypothetical protein
MAARRSLAQLMLVGDGVCLALGLVTLPGLAWAVIWLRGGRGGGTAPGALIVQFSKPG